MTDKTAEETFYSVYDRYIADLHNQKSPKDSFKLAVESYASQQLAAKDKEIAELKGSLKECKRYTEELASVYSDSVNLKHVCEKNMEVGKKGIRSYLSEP